MNGMKLPTGIKQEYLTDPRLALAQELAKAGGSTAPVASPMQGLARALQGAIGGYQQGQLRDEYQQRGTQYRDTLANALSLGTGKDGQPGDVNAMVAALAGNQDTADTGMSFQMEILKEKMKPKDPVKLGAGETLLDPTTFKPLATGAPKEKWETVTDPNLGTLQRNTVTGEVKPLDVTKQTEQMDAKKKADNVRQEALTVTERLLNNVEGVRANRGLDGKLWNFYDTSMDAEADLDTLGSLLTTENLGLLKGVLSDTDMKILRDIGAGGLKGSDDKVIEGLQAIKQKLGGAPAQTKTVGGKTYVNVNGEWYEQ